MTGPRWIVLSSLLCGQAALAGEADVLDVQVTATGGAFRFDVTVQHADEGWNHYADQWQVLGPDGRVLGTRELLHPHENEQPFSRRLTGVRIAPGIEQVTVRARDSVHGYGGREMTVNLPR
ncbi:MAG: hypothetical protein H6970_14305 [Gammaproteobacteria bacterium]|nr:hypothetical protein [Gammaproteobacteria bacterium]